MPRTLRLTAIALAGLLLVLFFLHRGFPYERLAERMAARAGSALGGRVEIPEIGPHWMLGGPGLQARGVRLTLRDGTRLLIDRVALRPAWSTAWLTGTPALYVQLESSLGRAAGVWRADGAWDGTLRDVALKDLPRASLALGFEPQGLLDAHIDLRWGEGADGVVVFEARDGTLEHPAVPVPLPFERCVGELIFGAGHLLVIESFQLDGPLLSARANGSLGEGPSFATAPLALELELEAREPARQLVRNAGVRLDAEGKGHLRLGGTPHQPRLR